MQGPGFLSDRPLRSYSFLKMVQSLLCLSEDHPPTRNIHSECYNWMAPKKPSPSDKFVAIFQVAQNPLKFAMSILFVLKNVHFFPRSEGRKIWQNCGKFNPPTSVSKQHRISILENQNTVCVCVCCTLLEVEGGGGGWTFKNLSEALFPPWKKSTGTFFHRKSVCMANFSRFS